MPRSQKETMVTTMNASLLRSIARPRAVNSVVAAGHTHAGGRPRNEDVLLVNASRGLYAVFDGMGGHAAGAVAARTARNALSQFTRKHAKSPCSSYRDLLETGIKHAAAAVYTTGQKKAIWNGMGTTVVACRIVDSTTAVFGHVGDSRAYLLRNDLLIPLTKDHNHAQDARDAGMSEEEIAQTHFRNYLTRSLGGDQGAEPEMRTLSIRPHDRILLCSDGLYECVEHNHLALVLGSHDDPSHAARALIDLARASPTISDNVSAVVLNVSGL
jgi:protein phosphatase